MSPTFLTTPYAVWSFEVASMEPLERVRIASWPHQGRSERCFPDHLPTRSRKRGSRKEADLRPAVEIPQREVYPHSHYRVSGNCFSASQSSPSRVIERVWFRLSLEEARTTFHSGYAGEVLMAFF